MRRGLALFWTLACASALLSWMEVAATHQARLDDVQRAQASLVRKRLIDRDVRATLDAALLRAEGRDAEERVLDGVFRLRAAEAYLESAYGREGVRMDVFFGFLSPPERDAWLDGLAQDGFLRKCPRCLDVDLGVSAILSSEAERLVLSKDGLHRQALPFVPFGVPVLGAVYGFGPLVGVAA